MENLFTSQQSLESKISNAYANFRAKGKDRMTYGTATSRLEGLEKSEFCNQSWENYEIRDVR